MEQISNLPDELPVLPSKNMRVFPTAGAMMTVDHEAALRLLDEVKESQHRLLVVAAQKSPDRTPMRLSDLFHVGTIARLVQMRERDDGKREIFVLGLERAAIGGPVQEQPYFRAYIAPRADIEALEGISREEAQTVVPPFQELIACSQKMPPAEINFHFDLKKPREMVYTMAFFAEVDFEHGRQVLEFDAIPAKLRNLKEYLLAELASFKQERQQALERLHSQGQTINTWDAALDALNTAATLEETSTVLTEQQSLLLRQEAVDGLRARIEQKRQQKASGRWIFLLERDLEILEQALTRDLAVAKQYLAARVKMLRGQQSAFEAMKVISILDIDDSQSFMHLLEKQEKEPFSPETFAALRATVEQIENPDYKKQLQTLLDILEAVKNKGKAQAIEDYIRLHKPDFEQEIDHTLELLVEYLTSESPEEAYQTLKQNQEVLLSNLAIRLLEQRIEGRYHVGDYDSARKLELHLQLFEDAMERSLDAAWQTFTEDDE